MALMAAVERLEAIRMQQDLPTLPAQPSDPIPTPPTESYFAILPFTKGWAAVVLSILVLFALMWFFWRTGRKSVAPS